MKKYAWISLVLVITTIIGCEKPAAIPSALRASIEQMRYSPADAQIYTLYRLNFKAQSIRFSWLNGTTPCYQTTVNPASFGVLDSLQISWGDLNTTLPTKLRCVLEVTTQGGDIIRDTSEPLNLGFLDNTPFANTPNFLAFWPLVDDFEDYTLNQNHLQSVGILFHSFLPNTNLKGTYFSNNAYLTKPHKIQLNPRALSISAYLYLDDLIDPANLHNLVSKRDYTGWGSSFELKVSKRSPDGYKVSVSWTINGTNNEFESSLNLPFKKAAHIVYVHDENTVQLWVNGKKTDEIASPGLLSNENNLPLCIGTRPGVRHSLNGYLRDVGIWGRALNGQEIENIATLYP